MEDGYRQIAHKVDLRPSPHLSPHPSPHSWPSPYPSPQALAPILALTPRPHLHPNPKVIGALRWSLTNVPSKYVLKTDDDSYLCAHPHPHPKYVLNPKYVLKTDDGSYLCVA